MLDNLLNGTSWLFSLVPLVVAIACAILCVLLVYKYHTNVGKGISVLVKALGKAITAIATVLWNNYTGIATFIKTKMFTRSAYFRYGILVCMVASVIHGSHLFVTSENIPVLNLLLAATFDIGIWVFIESMIYVRKRGYIVASLGILLIIAALSSVSFAANFVFNNQFYDASAFSALGDGAKNYIIIFQSLPPLVIIVMTVVAEIFTKTDVKEEVTLEQRLQKRNQRKIAKVDANLKLRRDIADTKQKYAISKVVTQPEEKKPESKQPVAVKPYQAVRWSFLGIIKMYDTNPSIQPEIIDTLQKITVTIVSVQQTINQLPNVVRASVQPQIDQVTGSMFALSQTVQEVGYRNVQEIPALTTPSNTMDTDQTPDIVTGTLNMHMHNDATSVPEQVVNNPVTNTQIDIDTTLLQLASMYPGMATWLTDGRTTASINDVAQTLKTPVKDVKKLVKDGLLEVSPLKQDMIRLNSLYTWLKQTKMIDVIQSTTVK